MAFEIDVEIRDSEVQRLLNLLVARMGNLTPAMTNIGETLVESFAKNFRAEGRPTPWKKSRRAATTGGQTLSLTGRLRRSFTRQAPEHIFH